MRISAVLHETSIGRALLAYWHDLVFWGSADALLIVALLPAWLVWSNGSSILAVAVSWPGALLISGIARAFGQTITDRPPRWRDFMGTPQWPVLSLWTACAILALSFLLPLPPAVAVPRYLVVGVVLLLAPFVLCSCALLRTGTRDTWRNALVMAVHFPFAALGLNALAVLLGVITLAVHPLLLLLTPALWVSIAVYTCREIVEAMR